MNENPWPRRASVLFCASFCMAGIWFAFRYLKAPLAVLLIARLVAAAVTPAARRSARLSGLPQKFFAALYTLLLFSGLGLLLVLGLGRMWEEVERLFAWLTENRGRLEAEASQAAMIWERRLSAFPLWETLSEREAFLTFWSETLDQGLRALGGMLASHAGNAARALPRAIFYSAVTVMASFYLSMDYEGIVTRLTEQLPASAARTLERLRKQVSIFFRQYVKAYLIFALLTFGIVFAGLLILRQSWAFLIACGVAAVDFLPIFGAGAVLLPWSVFAFLNGNSFLGTGLLILYALLTVVRQILEPRLVGGRLGLHPFWSLTAMFFGGTLFGFFGMILGPLLLLLLKGQEKDERKESRR